MRGEPEKEKDVLYSQSNMWKTKPKRGKGKTKGRGQGQGSDTGHASPPQAIYFVYSAVGYSAVA